MVRRSVPATRGWKPHRACRATTLLPGNPDLYGVFQAELARDLIGQQRGLGHEQSDQVVGSQQVDPEFFDGHRWGFAAQPLHAERRLDVAQVQLQVPAAAIQRLDGGFGCGYSA